MNAPVVLPPFLAQAATRLHGDAAEPWLTGLPLVLAVCAERWSLQLLPPFPNLGASFLAPALAPDGTSLVIKAGLPSDALQEEITALKVFAGEGAVRLIDADPALGVLLLERLEPGTPLAELSDDAEATSQAAEVMRRLWRPVPPKTALPTVADWGAGFRRLRHRYHGGTGPVPADIVTAAEDAFAELLGSMSAAVVLHGDLHHHNVLAARRAPWLAVDPKGVVGEPAYEAGALLRNPRPTLLAASDPRRLLRRRLDQLTVELALDRDRLQQWGFAQAVLAAWWSLEDNDDDWPAWIEVAVLLAECGPA